LYYFNQELAITNNAIYAPSVARARIVAQQRHSLLQELDTGLGRIAQELQPDHPQMPSMSNVLVRQGNAELIAVREQTRVLHSQLAAYLVNEVGMTSSQLHQARTEIKGMMTTLRHELGITAAPRFVDALEWTLMSPFPRLRVGKALDWWKSVKVQKQFSVLSEFAKVMADNRIAPHLYPKLHRNCCAAAVPG
jgi:hypothetical protein